MTSAVGLLDHLQRQLEAIYDLPAGARVSDFLIDRRGVEAAGGTVSAREEVFLVEGGEAGENDDAETVDLGLYLAPDLFERLRGCNPEGPSGLSLVTDELSAFTTIAEGVSHVLYLLRCAAAERPVKKLELETQAEIDKFAVCALHLWGRGRRTEVGALWDRLFDQVRLREDLSGEERDRYATAGRLGGRYARRLIGEHVEPDRLDGFLRDLRRTYRLSADEKLVALAA